MAHLAALHRLFDWLWVVGEYPHHVTGYRDNANRTVALV